MPPSHVLIYGFIAGFLAVLILHQGLWYLLNQMGVIPPNRFGLVDRSRPAARCAVGAVQGVFGAEFGVWR